MCYKGYHTPKKLCESSLSLYLKHANLLLQIFTILSIGKYLSSFGVMLQALAKGVDLTIKSTPFVMVQSSNLGLPKLFPLPIT